MDVQDDILKVLVIDMKERGEGNDVSIDWSHSVAESLTTWKLRDKSNITTASSRDGHGSTTCVFDTHILSKNARYSCPRASLELMKITTSCYTWLKKKHIRGKRKCLKGDLSAQISDHRISEVRIIAPTSSTDTSWSEILFSIDPSDKRYWTEKKQEWASEQQDPDTEGVVVLSHYPGSVSLTQISTKGTESRLYDYYVSDSTDQNCRWFVRQSCKWTRERKEKNSSCVFFYYTTIVNSEREHSLEMIVFFFIKRTHSWKKLFFTQ